MGIDDIIKNLNLKLPEKPNLNLSREAIIILIPVIFILIAELLILLQYDYITIWMHVFTVVALPLASIYFHEKNITMAFQSLMLLPLLRLVNISMPIFFETTLYTFVFIYGPLILPVFLVMRAQGLSFNFKIAEETKRKWPQYTVISLLVALFIAQGEYAIIDVGYLIPDLSLMSLIQLSIVMIFFVGFIEELIFRYILQTRLEFTFGIWPALIISSILFGAMHSGYGTFLQVVMTSIAGLMIGYMYVRTRSLSLITVTHGITNVFLFGIIPHLGPGLGLF